jgi:hypothetical protein
MSTGPDVPLQMMQEHGSDTSSFRSVIVKDADSPWLPCRPAIGLEEWLPPRRVPLLLGLTEIYGSALGAVGIV